MPEGPPIVFSGEYTRELQSPGHPESPRRAASIMERLSSEGLSANIITPIAATREEVLGVHKESLVMDIDNDREGYLDPDTYHYPYTYTLALLAAGGAITGAMRAHGTGEAVLVVPRPPGHHAGKDFFGGFCYFNNVAIAAQHLLDSTDAGRIAIVDIDVHHGNGTSDIFASRKDVLYISTHQWGIFPGTGPLKDVGIDDGEGFTVNLPLYPGMGDSIYSWMLERIILPILREFGPDHILVSLGMDAHYMDPLASLELTTNGIAGSCLAINTAARELCGGRVTFVVEGGYHLGAISETMALVAASLVGRELREAPIYNDARDPGEDPGMFALYKKQHSRYWHL